MRIPQEIKNMLRPKDCQPGKNFLFNLGDWNKYTLLGICGCRKCPHKFPLFFPERLVFLGFI